jgi:8-oxo-dGTP diphosphatase
MKKLIIETTNPAKIAQIRDAIVSTGILVEGINKSLISEVIEDGNTAQENAKKKATSYAKAICQTVFSMDIALYFDDLPPENQPGIHVRRIGGLNSVNDTELLEHCISLIELLGGKATGYWEYGICIAKPNGEFFEMTLKTPRIFTSEKSEKTILGYPLESIQIDPKTGKYISEMSPEEKATFWQENIGEKICSFVKDSLL